MSSRPWYKWFPEDYLGATLHLQPMEDLVYRRLLDVLWIQGPQPDDVRQLARSCRLDTRLLTRCYPTVKPLLSVSNGLVDHPRIAQQRAEVAEKSRKARAAGKKGGEANAEATRARARAHPCPQSESDQDLNPRVTELLLNLNSGEKNEPQSSMALTPEQRAEAEALQKQLAQKRAEAGVAPWPPPRVAALANAIARNSETRMDEEEGKE